MGDEIRYLKPKAIGGKLIRQVILFLKSQGLSLPLNSHILIATSGGVDSTALAHLLVHYGRRIAPRDRISLLHINHQWRGVESDRDEAFVQDLGARWQVPVLLHRLPQPDVGRNDAEQKKKKDSWEEKARQARKSLFAREAEKNQAVVLTAHQADDLAETILWRLLTGAAKTHGGGIAVRHGVEIRPFLTTRKSILEAYLQEEGEVFRNDETNFSQRFLRSRMRAVLMPEIEKIFPQGVEHLVRVALEAQLGVSSQRAEPLAEALSWVGAAGLKLRRKHFDHLEKWVANRSGSREIHLPGGWRLVHKTRPSEQWTLERM